MLWVPIHSPFPVETHHFVHELKEHIQVRDKKDRFLGVVIVLVS